MYEYIAFELIYISSQGHDSIVAMFSLLEMLDHIESEIAFS
jgi:hypothetical protein